MILTHKMLGTGTTPLRSQDGNGWVSEYRPCPACGSKPCRPIGARGGSAHRNGKGIRTLVVECVACGLLYARPTLIPLTNPYAAESADQYFHIHETEQKIRSGEAIALDAERILGRTGDLLELGCGRGESLVGAARRGWRVHGVEMTSEFAQIAASNGVAIEQCSIQDCRALDEPESYDVILLGAVLEHLYDPAQTLRRVHSALKPGGLVFVDVPNERSLALRVGNLYMRARGRDWCVNLSPTFAPYHVIGFSPTSLSRLLSASGFQIHTMAITIWNNAFDGGSAIQLLEHWVMSVAQQVGARIGMGDGIACWAMKKLNHA